MINRGEEKALPYIRMPTDKCGRSDKVGEKNHHFVTS